MRNMIIMTTSSKKLLKILLKILLTICKIQRYLGKTIDWEARVSLRQFEGVENICQLTNLIANSQLLKPFIESVSMNVLIRVIEVRFSLNF